MRTYLLILFSMALSNAVAQQIPITPWTYENCTIIDNYFGETDSLLLKHHIQSRKTYYRKDTAILIRVEQFVNGKKTSVDEFSFEDGKLKRSIRYHYTDSTLETDLIHYPASLTEYLISFNNLYPYLFSHKSPNETRARYKPDDTVSHIVRMHLRYVWKPDGSIHFKSFDKGYNMVDSFEMTPMISPEDYLAQQVKPVTGKVVHGGMEWTYDGSGKLLRLQNNETKKTTIYSYDERGLLTTEERLINNKPDFKLMYIYE